MISVKKYVPFINPSESFDNSTQTIYCAEGDVIFADASEDLEDVGKSIEIVALDGDEFYLGCTRFWHGEKREI